MVNSFLISHEAVIFNFPNGISVHIRQGPDNTSSVVAFTKYGMAYNSDCGKFDIQLGASAGDITLSVTELPEFLQRMNKYE